uniref:Putative ovule protein n=1 Tax=Solanum chacoense TaxID=4108 RepID=A0A0V0GW87_SOLCH
MINLYCGGSKLSVNTYDVAINGNQQSRDKSISTRIDSLASRSKYPVLENRQQVTTDPVIQSNASTVIVCKICL